MDATTVRDQDLEAVRRWVAEECALEARMRLGADAADLDVAYQTGWCEGATEVLGFLFPPGGGRRMQHGSPVRG